MLTVIDVMRVLVPEVVSFESGPGSTQDWSNGGRRNARVSRPAYCDRFGLSLFLDEPGAVLKKDFSDGMNYGTGVYVPGCAHTICL